MGAQQQMLMAASSGYSNYSAVDFDGTNDWLSRGANMTGAADGSQGIMSLWFRLDGGDGTAMDFINGRGGGVCRLRRLAGNQLQLSLTSAASLLSLSWSTTGIIASSTWRHILASWDANFAAGNKLMKVMIDGVETPGTVTDADIAFSIGYGTMTDWGLGANDGGGNLSNACFAEAYLNIATYLDVTQAANLALFRSGSGKPVNLGANGSTPTGAQPLVFDHVSASGAASDFGTNLGSGGGWTINGSLDLCSTAP